MSESIDHAVNLLHYILRCLLGLKRGPISPKRAGKTSKARVVCEAQPGSHVLEDGKDKDVPRRFEETGPRCRHRQHRSSPWNASWRIRAHPAGAARCFMSCTSGAPHTGNVEMWPLPECEAALPPVGMPPLGRVEMPPGPPRGETLSDSCGV